MRSTPRHPSADTHTPAHTHTPVCLYPHSIGRTRSNTTQPRHPIPVHTPTPQHPPVSVRIPYVGPRSLIFFIPHVGHAPIHANPDTNTPTPTRTPTPIHITTGTHRPTCFCPTPTHTLHHPPNTPASQPPTCLCPHSIRRTRSLKNSSAPTCEMEMGSILCFSVST